MAIQKILFGSPGTGKSYRIKNQIAKSLEISGDSINYFPAVFHPEYTYGDFMGKLMPFTNDGGKVEYRFYTGHFLKSLAQAYKNIIETYIEQNELINDLEKKFKKKVEKETGITVVSKYSEEHKLQYQNIKQEVNRKTPKDVILVIDEINRGNSAAIFGTVFQLLDREENGWSTYSIQISDLEFSGLLKEMSFLDKSYTIPDERTKIPEYIQRLFFNGQGITKREDYNKYQSLIFEEVGEENLIKELKIKIPPNLNIVATMNTSDNSIYFMDNAFKRRWDWEFINVEDDNAREIVGGRKINLYNEMHYFWNEFVDKLNSFIRSKHEFVRKIEDKQIGYFFINKDIITEEHIKNKLMFFVWDSIFNTNKKPLTVLLELEKSELITFGQFTKKEIVTDFVEKIMNYNV